MKQSGNALFLVLIAVALFASLSFAIGSSMRGSPNIKNEEVQLKATRIVQHAAELAAAVNRLQTINGCTPDQIDFGTNFTAPGFYCWAAPPVNPARRTDGSCDVYGANGGGVKPQYFDTSYCNSDWGTCAFVPMTIKVSGIGTASGEETVYWSHGVHVDLCRAINKALGISSSLAATNYTVGNTYLDFGGESTIGGAFAGKQDGCYCYGGPTGECNSYFTLMTR